MEAYTKKFWALVQQKLGAASALIEPIALQIAIPLNQGDTEGLRARAVQIQEAGEAMTAIGTGILEVTEDGTMDVADGADVVVLLETFFDESEDIVTGVDEDKPTTTTAKKKAAAKKK